MPTIASSPHEGDSPCGPQKGYVVSDPDILGGTPVIAGTRLTVYAVLGRMRSGETVDDLAADYPEIPRDAFAVAERYARTHPLREHPSGRPWRNSA